MELDYVSLNLLLVSSSIKKKMIELITAEMQKKGSIKYVKNPKPI
ncbi:hypothetical protein NX029_22970 [Cytobacillus firmus]|nr:hypothetical protein [Cytobacillus oceanisediminis]MCS0826799.1 hypothetical protein [Cytobacillus firmus]